MSTVGVIGLGRMGRRMGERLLETDDEILGYDVRDEAVADFESAGGTRADSPADVANGADVIVTSLPTPEIVEDVFCADDGILAGASEGLTVLDTTTSVPETTRALADVAREEGVRLVDAAVSGGTGRARKGTLTFMVGAEQGDLPPDAAAVLDALSQNAYFLGAVGTGHTTKLVNNVLSAGHRVLAMEAMALGTAHGVEPETLFEVVTNASGSSNQFEKRMPRVLNRNFEPGFTVDLSKKDVRLALQTSNEIDFPMMATSLVHDIYKEASAQGYGDEDACAIVKVIEENAGVEVASSVEMDEDYAGY